jgi:hypothetical protein
LVSHDAVFLVLYTWGASIIASLVVGLLVFKDFRNKRGLIKLLLVGASNMFTVIGASVAMFLFNTTASRVDPDLWTKLRANKYHIKRRLAFIALFIFVPLFLISLFSLSVVGYYLKEFIVDLYKALTFQGPWAYVIREIKPLLVLIFPTIGLLLTKKFLLGIKPQDKVLFDQLTASGFSTFTFAPKDSRKVKFLIFFSLFIVAIGMFTMFISFRGQDSMELRQRYNDYRNAPNFEVNPF